MPSVDNIHCGVLFSIIKLRLLFILLVIITLTTLNYLIRILTVCEENLNIPTKLGNIDKYNINYLMTKDRCKVIHIGVVSVGITSNLFFYTLLKSLYFYRTNPLHFHVLVNDISKVSISTLFDTWSVSQVNITLYDADKYMAQVSRIKTHHYSGTCGLLKLIFPEIVSGDISRMIVLDSDIVFNGNIMHLWLLFNNFNQNQFIGLIENQSDFYLSKRTMHWPAAGRGYNTGIILYHLHRMRRVSWSDIWYRIANDTASIYGATSLADQDVINAVIKRNPEILFEIPCYWNIQLSDNTHSSECYRINSLKVIHWNSPRKIQVANKDGVYFRSIYNRFSELNGNSLRAVLNDCSSSSTIQKAPQIKRDVCEKFNQIESNKWRTLLFFRIFEYTYSNDDVTFVAQFSYDRLHMLAELCKLWTGPMSLTLYATDSEFQDVIQFLHNLDALRGRTNIGFHVVFKSGEYYPINFLRNVGLTYVYTPYVFLADIDFLPMHDLHFKLRQYIMRTQNMYKKALIIPAFETQKYKSKLPINKKELVDMLEKKEIFSFRYDVWPAGHAPTNYTRWKTALASYQIKWDLDFEPYVVVASNVTKYDVRFMGFGWNKVSHIMELHAQGYQFFVLPDVFIIHKSHAPSNDILKFRRSSIYRMCLKKLKEEFIKMLRNKYNKDMNNPIKLLNEGE